MGRHSSGPAPRQPALPGSQHGPAWSWRLGRHGHSLQLHVPPFGLRDGKLRHKVMMWVGTNVGTLASWLQTPLDGGLYGAEAEGVWERRDGRRHGASPAMPWLWRERVLVALPSGLGNGAEPMAAPGLQHALVSCIWHNCRHPSLFYDRYICFPAWEREEKKAQEWKMAGVPIKAPRKPKPVSPIQPPRLLQHGCPPQHPVPAAKPCSPLPPVSPGWKAPSCVCMQTTSLQFGSSTVPAAPWPSHGSRLAPTLKQCVGTWGWGTLP